MNQMLNLVTKKTMLYDYKNISWLGITFLYKGSP